jgi:hypothetical protein
MWSAFIWFRLGATAGYCEQDNYLCFLFMTWNFMTTCANVSFLRKTSAWSRLFYESEIDFWMQLEMLKLGYM